MKMEQIEYFETSTHKIQTPGNHPKERIQHSEHGESLKSGRLLVVNNLKLSLKKIQSIITHVAQYVGK
jgi:hypothetical protein